MSNEWLETTGQECKPGAIRKQFHKLTVTNGNDNTPGEPPRDFETCTISDLQELIKAGKKFGAIYVGF